VRLLPNGSFDPGFLQQRVNTLFRADLPNQQLLISETTDTSEDLYRLNPDGTRDLSFSLGVQSLWRIHRLQIQPDSKILIKGLLDLGNNSLGEIVTRLNANGSIDQSFNPGPGEVMDFFVRANGKLILQRRFMPGENWEVVQLNNDGTIDSTFVFDMNLGAALDTWVEQPDGRILIAYGPLRRLNLDGRLDPTFDPVFKSPCFDVGHMLPTIGLASSGEILFSGIVSHVDGFPVSNFVQLIDRPPVPAFRLYSSHLKTASGSAVLKVVRTGPTTNPASVEYTTVDDSEKAGLDYTASSGVLVFAPLEASKEVIVPILRHGAVRFSIKLSNQIPEATYSVPDAIRVQVDSLPEFRLTHGLNGSTRIIRVDGTAPGETYLLQQSGDLKIWTTLFGQTATSSMLEFGSESQTARAEYYRIKLSD
jgi:uncharacterized delta-60 repeat protein